MAFASNISAGTIGRDEQLKLGCEILSRRGIEWSVLRCVIVVPVFKQSESYIRHCTRHRMTVHISRLTFLLTALQVKIWTYQTLSGASALYSTFASARAFWCPHEPASGRPWPCDSSQRRASASLCIFGESSKATEILGPSYLILVGSFDHLSYRARVSLLFCDTYFRVSRDPGHLSEADASMLHSSCP